MVQTVVNHLPEIEVSETLRNKYLIENYNFGNMYLPIKKDEINKFENEIILNFNTKSYKFNYGSHIISILENDKIFIEIYQRKNLNEINIFTKERELFDLVFKIYQKYKDYYDEKYIELTEFSFVNGKINEKYKDITLEDLNVSEDFYPFLNSKNMIEMFLNGKENLLILGGKPGTGKSKFCSLILAYAIENKDDFIVATAKDINLLSMDIFWQKIANYDLLILDDLDFMLGSRNESREDIQKNNFLSKLLSFTDGVINHNTKIIITTNQPINEIDEALLREGRIFDILNFRYLTKYEAKKILSKYNIDVELDDEVPQSKVGSLIENKLSLGKFERDYLKEDISLLHKKVAKKVGFL